MEYILIAVVVLYLLYAIMKHLFLGIISLVRNHKYLAATIIIASICLAVGGRKPAAIAIMLSLLIWGIILGTKSIQLRLWELHQKKFEAWLGRYAMELGQTSAQAMLNGTQTVQIPNQFMRYSYPRKILPDTIVEKFLANCQESLESRVKESLYERVRHAGMISEHEAQEAMLSEYRTATRCNPLTEIYAKAAAALEAEHKLDRPTYDKKVLHCIGVSGGSQLEVEVLDIDI